MRDVCKTGYVWARFKLRNGSADVIAAVLPLPHEWHVAVTFHAHWPGHVNKLFLQGPSTTRFAVAHCVETELARLQAAGDVCAYKVDVPQQGPDLY